MSEISERHVEWATVSRMRDMLPSVRRDFEITQTFTLFTGILCWTIQRIRWRQDTSCCLVTRLPMLESRALPRISL